MMFDDTINDDNANNDVEMNIHINRTVPTDLLPLNEKDVNKNWAEKHTTKVIYFLILLFLVLHQTMKVIWYYG